MKTMGIILILFSIMLISGGCAETEELTCKKATCCHATECLPEGQAPDCSDILCTQECVPGTIDCGQGSCQEVEGECKAVLK